MLRLERLPRIQIRHCGILREARAVVRERLRRELKPDELQLMLAQESGEWEQSSRLAKQMQLNDEDVSEKWWQAMQWAQNVTNGV